MRILVVDDERLLVKGIKFNLENEGYDVGVAMMASAPWRWPKAALSTLWCWM